MTSMKVVRTREYPFAESFTACALRWIIAAVCVLALHAGAAAALIFWPEDADNDSAGAIAIELAPLSAPMENESAQLPPGPLTPEVAPSEQAVKHITEKPLSPVVAPPSPLASNAEVAAAPTPEQEPEKPQPEKEQKAEQDRPQQAELSATAPPALEAPRSQTSAAPVAGISALTARAQASWYRQLLASINRHKRYPKAARAQHLEGLVKLQFTLDRAGRVLTAQVVQSSGSQLLDEEAIAMLQRAAPLPLPPPETPGSTVDLLLPIRFEIK